MKNIDLQKMLTKYPDDHDVVLSTYHFIDKEGDLCAVEDDPILGIAENDLTNEIRFMVKSDIEALRLIEAERAKTFQGELI